MKMKHLKSSTKKSRKRKVSYKYNGQLHQEQRKKKKRRNPKKSETAS